MARFYLPSNQMDKKYVEEVVDKDWIDDTREDYLSLR